MFLSQTASVSQMSREEVLRYVRMTLFQIFRALSKLSKCCEATQFQSPSPSPHFTCVRVISILIIDKNRIGGRNPAGDDLFLFNLISRIIVMIDNLIHIEAIVIFQAINQCVGSIAAPRIIHRENKNNLRSGTLHNHQSRLG
ncbi:hypothetical protein QC760_005793 [Botrytis cinerea]